MTDNGAARATATMADTETCPVCALVVPVGDRDDDIRCPRCALVVHSGPRLGAVTDELRRQLDEQRLAAIRGLEALAVVRAAGYPGAEDRARRLRLGRLVSGPPLTDEEVGNARSLAAAAQARLRPDCGSPQQAALSALGAGTATGAEGHVVVVGRHGLVLRIFAATGVENAMAARWSWPQLFDDAPQDEDARLLWLAGGAGQAALEPGTVGDAARRWADREARGWAAAAVLRRDPGWAVPDAFADELAGLLTARTLTAVPDLVLAPSASPDDWWTPMMVRGSAWGMAPGYPAAGRVAVVVGTSGGAVTVAWVGPDAADAEPRTMLQLPRLVTAVSADGEGILAGSVLGDVGWAPVSGSAGRGSEPVSLPPHSGRVSAVAANSRMLLTLGSEGLLHRIRMGGGGPELSTWATVEIGSSGATTLAIAQRAPVAVTGGADGILRVVDTEDATRGDVRLGVPITALALDPDGQLAVVGHGDGGVAVVMLADGASRRLFAVTAPPAGPLAVLFTRADASVVAADATGLLTAWSGSLSSGEGGTKPVGRHVGGVAAVHHLSRDRMLATGRLDGVLRAWSIPRSKSSISATGGETP